MTKFPSYFHNKVSAFEIQLSVSILIFLSQFCIVPFSLSAVIGYLLESDAATCIFSPDEYLKKYEKPYDFVLASGRLSVLFPPL